MGASQKYPDMDRDAFEFNENVSEHKFGLVWIGLCSLMTPGLSKDIRCHMTMLLLLLNFANHQIRHQATHKVGCLPDDSTWSRSSSSGVCAFQLCMFLSSQELKFHILYFWLKTITCCKNQSAVKVYSHNVASCNYESTRSSTLKLEYSMLYQYRNQSKTNTSSNFLLYYV